MTGWASWCLRVAGVGMTYAILYVVDAIYDPGSLELFTNQVIPEFQ